MSDVPSSTPAKATATLADLELRLARLEQHLGLPPLSEAGRAVPNAPLPSAEVSAALAPVSPPEDLEEVVGQNWFANVGIIVLTCGVGFALSLPFSSLGAAVPALIGYLLCGGLFLASHFGRQSLGLMAPALRGAAMALLCFSTLRLFFFGAAPALAVDSFPGLFLLLATVALNVAYAIRQPSGALLVIALLTGYVVAVTVNSPWWLGVGLVALALLIAIAAQRRRSPGLLLLGIAAGYAAYLLWMLGNPWAGRSVHLTVTASATLYFLLLHIVIVGAGPLLGRGQVDEDQLVVLTAVFNCGIGYGLFLAHSYLAFPAELIGVQLLAAVAGLGLAAAFWSRGENRVSVFFYAMTGYLALTVAILKAFPAPTLFVWLSLQSLLVVATALWFRSRFIVVANFAIFVLIVIAYMLTTERETGISLGFGIVALLTARILNWKQERLELQTQLMRNAYLAGAFIVFPYALYHLVPRAYVSVAWVGLALVYYAVNLIARNVKYRWMAHLTLLLTVIYVVIAGLTSLEPAYRIASFLVLGTVLVVVSLLFGRMRGRWRGKPAS